MPEIPLPDSPEQAATMLAEAYAIGREKRANTLQDAAGWLQGRLGVGPDAARALVGAGLGTAAGGGLGLLYGMGDRRKRNPWAAATTGALAGAGLGAGLSQVVPFGASDTHRPSLVRLFQGNPETKRKATVGLLKQREQQGPVANLKAIATGQAVPREGLTPEEVQRADRVESLGHQAVRLPGSAASSLVGGIADTLEHGSTPQRLGAAAGMLSGLNSAVRYDPMRRLGAAFEKAIPADLDKKSPALQAFVGEFRNPTQPSLRPRVAAGRLVAEQLAKERLPGSARLISPMISPADARGTPRQYFRSASRPFTRGIAGYIAGGLADQAIQGARHQLGY